MRLNLDSVISNAVYSCTLFTRQITPLWHITSGYILRRSQAWRLSVCVLTAVYLLNLQLLWSEKMPKHAATNNARGITLAVSWCYKWLHPKRCVWAGCLCFYDYSQRKQMNKIYKAMLQLKIALLHITKLHNISEMEISISSDSKTRNQLPSSLNNNNNTNGPTQNNIYVIVITTKALREFPQFILWTRNSIKRLPAFEPSQLTF